MPDLNGAKTPGEVRGVPLRIVFEVYVKGKKLSEAEFMGQPADFKVAVLKALRMGLKLPTLVSL